MSDVSVNAQSSAGESPRWQPISAIDRRVLGVLAEKAKTTPDIYPMSLNGICTGCNQKSNRDPLMQLEPEDVEESLDRLRAMGAVGLVEGYGRVTKYRHYMYDWLGVDKVEMAVMTELLLRGDQTLGELRTRASRMEPISDLNSLHSILSALKSRNLVVYLTPEGRGQVVTHGLYKPRELENLREKYSGARPAATSVEHTEDFQPKASAVPSEPSAERPASVAPPASAPNHAAGAVSLPAMPPRDAAGIEVLRRELNDLRTRVTQLQQALDDSVTDHRRLSDELRSLKDALGA